MEKRKMAPDFPPAPTPSVPWYRNGEHYRSIAAQYLTKFRPLDEKSRAATELDNFIVFNTARLVFESNLIEGA